jgi:hypothetical protein
MTHRSTRYNISLTEVATCRPQRLDLLALAVLALGSLLGCELVGKIAHWWSRRCRWRCSRQTPHIAIAVPSRQYLLCGARYWD